MKKIVELKIPVELYEYEEESDVVLVNTKMSLEMLGEIICVQGKNFEEAEKEFWESFKCISNYHRKRSQELDKYKPLQFGNWKHIGGTWFIVFGINVYFRYGNKMKGGKYIPFTKLNISIKNLWKN